jgi:hypothetical protein
MRALAMTRPLEDAHPQARTTHHQPQMGGPALHQLREDRLVTATDRKFVAWGYITGAALHTGFRIGDQDDWFALTTAPPESFRRLSPPGYVESRMPGGFYVTGVKRQPRVGSRMAFQVTVTASDPDIAFTKAQVQILPFYLAGLSSIAEEPLFAAVVAVHAQGNEGWFPRVSSSELLFTPKPRMLRDEELQDLPGLVWAAQHDATGRLAATEFHAANMSMASRTGAVADDQAILSTYYFVLERIANRLNKDQPLRSDPEDARRRIGGLQKALEDAPTVEAQVTAVQDAHRDLQSLSRRGMRRGIRDAGQALGIPDDQIAEAIKFTDLRNKKLGHPAPLGEHSSELETWLSRAQRCAMTYLAAYLRWVDERGFASFTE